MPKLPNGEERLLKTASRVQFEFDTGDDLFMDIRNRSNYSNFDNVMELVSDRKIWKNLMENKFGKNDHMRRISDHKLQVVQLESEGGEGGCGCFWFQCLYRCLHCCVSLDF